MSWFARQSIPRQLNCVVLSVCGVVLLLTAAAIGGYEIVSYRRALHRDTTMLADVVAMNVSGALAFEDEKAAVTSLLAFRSDPHATMAGLYRANGSLFAQYSRSGSGVIPPKTAPAPATAFTSDALTIVRPVTQNDRVLGWILVQRDLEEINGRMLIFAGITAGTLLIALVIAGILSSRMQRPISAPILQLAKTARGVSERRDFSLRAPAHVGGEVGDLTTAFNEMLSTIEQGRVGLIAANERLKAEVAERQLAEDRASAQAARLAQLNEITRAIAERQDVESVFQAVSGSVEAQLAVDFVCVCTYDENRELLNVTTLARGSHVVAEDLGMVPPFAIAIEPNGLTGCLRGELLYEPNALSIAKPLFRRLSAGGLRAVVVSPLLVESRVFGILLAARRRENSFTSGDCEFLRQLSENVALAAHQSQLYAALQRAYDDLRQTQQAVMQQERLRALGQMASGIAHDINNAISPISLYIESMIEKEPHLSPQARERLTIVQRAIDDVAQTVARMREFYRQRPQEATQVRVRLNELVAQVIELTKARWFDMPQQRGVVINFQTDLARELPYIKGAEGEIREALTNLIFNAVDAMPMGGTLRIRTFVTQRSFADAKRSSEPRVVIEVSDNGGGMSEETLRRCLEPFFTTKGERGSGMGLAMVYGMVTRHHGEIDIQSQEHKGTTVQLLFPVASGPEPFRDLPPLQPQRQLKILLVDDDPLLLKSVSEILGSDGHRVTTASGGQEGINTFSDTLKDTEPFDAVVTDLGMPYVDGRRVAAAVKAASPQTPVFLLTGWGHRLATEGDVPVEVDRVLNKPPKLRDLREALASVTEVQT